MSDYTGTIASALQKAASEDAARQARDRELQEEHKRITARCESFLNTIILTELEKAAAELEKMHVVAEVGNGRTDGRLRRTLSLNHPSRPGRSGKLTWELAEGMPGLLWKWDDINMARLDPMEPQGVIDVIRRFISATLAP